MAQKRIAEGFPGQRLIVVPRKICKEACSRPICRDVFPTHIGMFQSARHHFVSRDNGADEHVLIACLSGRGRCNIRGREWALEPGNIIFLPENVRHEYSADADDPWSIFWVHFTGEKSGDYLEYLSVSEQRPLIAVSNIGNVIDAFEDIYQHTENVYTNTALLCLTTALSRFLGITRMYQRAAESKLRSREDKVLAVQRILRDSLHRKVRLDELAQMVSWSAPHLSTVFKRQVGISPMDFFARLKIQRACTLLKVSEESVAYISAGLGYDDSFYFSRLFRKHIGMSPSEYKRKYALTPGPKGGLPG